MNGKLNLFERLSVCHNKYHYEYKVWYFKTHGSLSCGPKNQECATDKSVFLQEFRLQQVNAQIWLAVLEGYIFSRSLNILAPQAIYKNLNIIIIIYYYIH